MRFNRALNLWRKVGAYTFEGFLRYEDLNIDLLLSRAIF